jgi:hypothetical protein
MAAGRNQGTSSSGSDDTQGTPRKPWGYFSAIVVGPPSADNDGRTNDTFVDLGEVWENTGGKSLTIRVNGWPLAWLRNMPTEIKFFIKKAAP